MSTAKVAQQVTEVIGSLTTPAKVSQAVIEVSTGFTAPTVPYEDASVAALGSLGDECNSTTLDAMWTLRNIASVSGDGAKYSVLFDAQGDAITRAFTDTGQNFSITTHQMGMTDGGGMIGPCALNASGNGTAFSRYNDANTYLWAVTGYNYAGTGPAIGSTPTIGDHWLQMKREGGLWYGRHSSNGTTWSAWSSARTDATTITQIGLVRAYTSGGSQTVGFERFISPTMHLDNFTGGAMVSQEVVEVLMSSVSSVRASQIAIEVLMVGSGAEPTGAAPSTHSHTFTS